MSASSIASHTEYTNPGSRASSCRYTITSSTSRNNPWTALTNPGTSISDA